MHRFSWTICTNSDYPSQMNNIHNMLCFQCQTFSFVWSSYDLTSLPSVTQTKSSDLTLSEDIKKQCHGIDCMAANESGLVNNLTAEVKGAFVQIFFNVRSIMIGCLCHQEVTTNESSKKTISSFKKVTKTVILSNTCMTVQCIPNKEQT